MPSLSRSARILAVLSLVAMVPALGWAQNKRQSLELVGVGSFTHYDPDSKIQSDSGPTLLVGYNFTRRHGAEVSFTTQTSDPDGGAAFPVDVDIIKVGYVFNAYPNDTMVTFFRSGIGSFVIHPDAVPGADDRLESSDHRLMVWGGGGLRYFFTDAFALRFEGTIEFVDSPDGFGHPDIQGTGSIGVSFLVGGKEEIDAE